MNTVTDLRTEMDTLADRAPSDEAVRRSLTHGIARHAQRRRATALIAAAAAVVVVAGGAGIAGALLSHRSTGPAGPTPVVTVPDVPLPPDTQLIRHQLQPVSTPVTATPPDGLTGTAWFSAPDRLAVSLFDPDPNGQPAKGSASYGPEGSTTHTAGYVLTDQRDEALTVVGDSGATAATATRTPITVGGHRATLETAPEGTLDGFGFPADRRITWQLADGRWIHVWASGLPGDDALQTFAAGITETPQTLNRTIGIGLTLPGHTVDSSMNSAPIASIVGAMLYLCPPGVDPMGEASGSASTGSGSSNPDGTTSESETSSDPASRCVGATVLNQPGNGFASGPTQTVTVGDTVAHVDTGNSTAWADLTEGLIAAVQAPASAHLSKADLAALVASVRVSPAVTALRPQPLQGQGHAEGGAVGTEASGVAQPLPTLSALPTAQTTLPAAGPLVAPTPLPNALPFGFQETDRGWYSSWSITPTSAAGQATVMLDDGTAVGGQVRWNKSGPDGIPTGATPVTAGGHPAHQWQTKEQSGTVAHLAWTLPDGSGLELFNDPVTDPKEAAREVTAFAAAVTDGSIAVPSIALPDKTIQRFTEPRIAFVAGPGTGSSTDGDGSSRSAQAAPTVGTPTVWNAELCPDGTPPNVGGETANCLRTESTTGDTALQAAYLLQIRPDWKVATVGGDQVYVSPDGRSVARVGTPTAPRTADSVTAEGTNVSTSDLVAILLSIPG